MKLFKKIYAFFTESYEPSLISDEQFEGMSLRQKAYYSFTDEQWASLTRNQKKRVFYARNKFKASLEKKA